MARSNSAWVMASPLTTAGGFAAAAGAVAGGAAGALGGAWAGARPTAHANRAAPARLRYRHFLSSIDTSCFSARTSESDRARHTGMIGSTGTETERTSFRTPGTDAAHGPPRPPPRDTLSRAVAYTLTHDGA